jgi:hypothetical protein
MSGNIYVGVPGNESFELLAQDRVGPHELRYFGLHLGHVNLLILVTFEGTDELCINNRSLILNLGLTLSQWLYPHFLDEVHCLRHVLLLLEWGTQTYRFDLKPLGQEWVNLFNDLGLVLYTVLNNLHAVDYILEPNGVINTQFKVRNNGYKGIMRLTAMPFCSIPWSRRTLNCPFHIYS